MSEKNFSSQELVKYEGHYSENKFWGTLRKYAKKAGVRTVYYALVLYYTLMDPATPRKYKNVIMGALGYLILPFDFIMDYLPGIGLVDDWGALLAAVAYVITAVTPEHKRQARSKLGEWFPKVSDGELGDLA